MKNLVLVSMLAVIFSFTACAQKNDVPEKAKNAFTQKFPDAKKVKWSKEDKNVWEAEFKMDGKEYSANFTTEGSWKETEYEIKKSDIPPAVKESLDKEFAGYKMEEAEISETADGKVYEFELEKDQTNMEVAISPEGKVVKKEAKEEENDEKDDD